ncbi:hypothetical protein LGL08_08100 [Clostridium estertheticum]|uniref:hypothetical protein n=1 Tax=Clostridium estertheticum TaxID=238834 RepID=UPI001CF1775E|nr:hypothetical protein [Clostridium estertheticum]MCB2308132.1 hypothetical protein [Clostridium estertheticum]MCB2346289.1 hypothetical protein [Clostridium estertheticum]MCB2349519.1 hypothetical protein [Clostridium estertheticum]WAG46490.1 hypothetical protein LL127_02775 [Clostridium estertheticum]
MINLKKHKKCILVLICLISLSILMVVYNNQNPNKQHSNFGHIDKNNITSFKVRNMKGEEKEIKTQSDRDNLIDLINSLKITKSGVELRDGIGFGVIIIYSNGEKFSASFLASSMVYLIDDKSICCDIDKNIVDDLRNCYDKN